MTTTIKYYVKVTAVTGSPLIRCHYVNSSSEEYIGWGATLVAEQADFESTNEFYAESDVEVTGTGWISFTLNSANVDPNGTLYLRLEDLNSGGNNTESITIASTNNATAADRPYLEITVTADATYYTAWTCTT
jgi:hypothetical protein